MTALLELREYLRSFYIRFETWLAYAGRFVLAWFSLWLIGERLGYQRSLTSGPIILMAALLCCIMPLNFTIVVCAAFILGHLYALSLQYLLMGFVLFMLMFLLYFRFSPRDSLAVILTAILAFFKLPYIMPIALGLLSGPAAAVAVGCGLMTAYLISYVSENAQNITAVSDNVQESATQFQLLFSDFMDDKKVWVMIAAFALTLIVVYFIRRLPVDHCWTIATVAGAVVMLLSLLVGDLMFSTNISLINVILGTFLSIGVALVIQFMVFNLDYPRMENVQFEDDDYYYYVKAIPKVTMATPRRRVKKINRQPARRDDDDYE